MAFALAMISAYDRFFGGAESVEEGRLVTGRDGKDLLPFAEAVPVPPALGTVGLGLPLMFDLFKDGRDVKEGLSRDATRGDRGYGFAEFPFGRGNLFVESVRAVLVLGG